ncbi:DUF6443 domain-containing protein, partial [Dysgonomonas sp. ZJ709]|uniref:DUF6443 domain-containing protein n=1 Tax=Dysgonomonas sp. ZJ709 TaxID=2709797 RepID=UPI00210581CC
MKRLLFTLYLLSTLSLQAQDTREFAVTHPKAETVTACKGINLKPGFTYKATTGGALVFNINTSVCAPAATTTAIAGDQNYIMTITPLGQTKSVTYNAQKQIVVDRTIEGDVPTMVSIQYFDGLGRPVQTVQRGITPSGADLISLQEYDSFGRESNTWLPATMPGNNGAFAALATIQANAKTTNTNNGTKDDNPFSKPVYEASPLNRVVLQYGPGADWHTNSKAVKTDYMTNTATGDQSCSIFKVSGSKDATTLSKGALYAANQLYVTKMTDEDGYISYEFKDKLGQVVLTRQMNGSVKHDTYYVYDDFGNLCYVLPPRATDDITSFGDDTDLMKQLVYLYKYDERNRCIKKRIPGTDWVHYVYDKADRLILSQDGEQRTKGEWTYSIPDVFDRVVVSGTCTNSITNLNVLNNVVVTATYSGASEIYKGYAISNFTPSGSTLLAVNYYDNYTYLTKHGFVNTGYNTQSGFPAMYATPKGQLTGSATALMDGSGKFLYTSMYYDSRARLVQTKSLNHMDADEREYIAYNFTGQPVKKYHRHEAKGKPVQEELYTYSYDHAGRPTETRHQLNNGTTVILAKNTYDDLGRLKTNVKNANANLTTTYAYNVRSWTKSIAGPLFKQTLYYNDQYAGSTKSYSGNIGAMDWTVTGDKTRGYAFTYDNLSRLTAANYLENATANSNYKVEAITYDKHGNMKTIKRYGKTSAGTTFGIVDNLTMTHTGNQLLTVNDAGVNVTISESADFKNNANTAAEYSYNKNGAMSKDLNKGISDIQYNSLNLPKLMDVNSSGTQARIVYTYSAAGTKLQTQYLSDKSRSMSPMSGMMTESIIGYSISPAALTATKTVDYVGNKVYENGSLKRVLVDGGYVEGGVYYFFLTDHLGNNRVVANAGGTVVQKSHYYPFGMAFAESTDLERQPYKYNGKELEQEHQLNMYDYHARQMEPGTGRFMSVDPLAEKYYNISPYA